MFQSRSQSGITVDPCNRGTVPRRETLAHFAPVFDRRERLEDTRKHLVRAR